MPTWTAWLVYCQRTGVSSTSVNACQDVFATLGTFANSETEFACLPTTGRSLRSHSNNNNGERQNSSNRCMRYLRHLHLRHLPDSIGNDQNNWHVCLPVRNIGTALAEQPSGAADRSTCLIAEHGANGNSPCCIGSSPITRGNGSCRDQARTEWALSRYRRSVAVNVACNRRHAVADARAQARNEPARSSLKCGRRSR
jgi:hypothetical protein